MQEQWERKQAQSCLKMSIEKETEHESETLDDVIYLQVRESQPLKLKNVFNFYELLNFL